MRRFAAAIALAAALDASAAGPSVPETARVCTPCHGVAGVSVQPDAPNLAAQPRAYLVAQLQAYRSGKRSSEQMGVIAKGLSDEQIEALAEWFSSLSIEVKRPPK